MATKTVTKDTTGRNVREEQEARLEATIASCNDRLARYDGEMQTGRIAHVLRVTRKERWNAERTLAHLRGEDPPPLPPELREELSVEERLAFIERVVLDLQKHLDKR
ncbi:MAG: hypothetical protein ACE5EF_00030 [Dehalococcoidia bacterium]